MVTYPLRDDPALEMATQQVVELAVPAESGSTAGPSAGAEAHLPPASANTSPQPGSTPESAAGGAENDKVFTKCRSRRKGESLNSFFGLPADEVGLQSSVHLQAEPLLLSSTLAFRMRYALMLSRERPGLLRLQASLTDRWHRFISNTAHLLQACCGQKGSL